MKKLLTYVVVVATLAWSLGLAAVVPMASAAYSPVAGDLVKVAGNPAVYYVGSDAQKHLFSNEVTFWTWYSGTWKDQTIQTISQVDFDNLNTGANVIARPGVNLIKFENSPRVYAVTPSGVVRQVVDSTGNDEVAIALYGSSYASKIIVIQNAFETNYTKGDVLTKTSNLPDGSLIKYEGGTDTYYIESGKKRLVTGDAFVANKFKSSAVITVATSMAYDTGSSITGAEAALANVISGSAVVVTGGNVVVSVAGDNPAAGNIADGTAYNTMLKLNLSAGDKEVKVTGITVTKTGLIANSNITGISIWDQDGNKHGDVMTAINSDNKATIGFGSYPITIAAGQTRSLTIAYNIGASANSGTVGVKVMSASDIATNGTVSGNFPVIGNDMTILDGFSSLAAVTVAAQAVGGNAASTDTANVEIGETKEIAKVRFTETSGYNDIALNKITFYVEGTAKDKDLKDFTLYAPDNSVIGTASAAYDKYVTITLNSSYIIPKSSNKTLTLKATVADGSGNYFRIQVQSEYDVIVKDNSLGYAIIPSDNNGGTWSSEVDSASGYFKMKSGSAIITKSTTSPAGNVSAGATDIVLGKFEVKAVGEDIEIRKMGLQVATTSESYAKHLTGNVKIKADDQILLTTAAGDTAYTLYGSASTQYTLSQYLTIKSGETKVIEIIGSVNSSATSTSDFTAKIGNLYVKRLSTLDYADNIPSSSLTSANNLTVQSTSLSFVKDTSMGNATIATGGTQTIGQYLVKAGSAEGISITGLTVKFNGTTAVSAPEAFQNLQIFADDVQLGSTISSVATSSNSFSFNLNLDKNQSKVIKVKAYVTTSASGTASTTVDSFTYVGRDTNNATTDTSTDPVGQDVTFGSANVVITAVTDSTSISKIVTTNSSGVQVGKWQVKAENEGVTLKKITFTVKDDTFATDTSAGNFGSLALYDSTNLSSPIAYAAYVPGSGNGYVQFSGFELPIAAGTSKFLVVKTQVNASGTMNSSSSNALVITSDNSNYLEIYANSGSLLGTSAIDAVRGDDTDNAYFATSTYTFFHDAYPEIVPVNVSSLGIGANTPIFKFSVTNKGTVDMRFTTTTITTIVTGLTYNGAATGTIGVWKLWEANESGNIGTQLAATSTTGLAGAADATMSGVTNFSTGNSISLTFGDGNDVNSMLNNFTIAPGTTRTFIVTADTTYIGAGKGSNAFTVQVNGKISGTTGWSGTGWNSGNFYYFYTPTGGSENSTAYTQSDSYDIVGDSISKTF